MVNPQLRHCFYTLLGAVCAGASLACAVLAWQGAGKIRRFRADAESKDAGVLKQQDEKDVVFRLTNATESPVEIVKISTSCSCMGAEVARRKLQPGESTELTARLGIGSRRGRLVALVNVLYRGGVAQGLERLPLTITATIESHYAVIPADVVFKHNKDVRKDSNPGASVAIAPNSEPAVRILKAYSTHPAIRVETITFDTATGSSTIHLRFDPSLCIAPTAKAEIVVHTDSKMQPIHHVPVQVVSKENR